MLVRGSRWWVVSACLAVAAGLGGCALHRTAGTGDVAFRLAWQGESDLDLIVQDPTGDCVNFLHRESPSGGELDVDCNAGPDELCAAPVENVYWPHGTAPAGRYWFWAHAHSLIPAEAPLPYQVQVLRGPEVVWVRRLTARDHHELQGAWQLELPAGRISGPLGDEAAANSPCVSVSSGVVTYRER